MPISKRPGIAVREDPVIDPAEGSEMLYATSDRHREYNKQYKKINRDNNTEYYKKSLEYGREYYYRNQDKYKKRRAEYYKNNKIQENATKYAWRKRTGFEKKRYKKRGELQNKISKDSGYGRIKRYLNHNGLKPPLNFTMSYVNKTWAWNFAHP